MRKALPAAALLALNAWICRELFGAGFIHNLDSNEGAFVALSRFFREHWFGELGWYGWVNAGIPVENAYQPLLPFLAALAGKVGGWPVERAFHFVLAGAYCAGPVGVFWLAVEGSESWVVGVVAGLAFSLLSPAELLIPVLRVAGGAGGHWVPLRFYNLIHYGEDPHNLALSLLPFGLVMLWRAMRRAAFGNAAGAVALCALVVLANAFGAVDLAIGGACILLAVRRGWLALLLVGVAAYGLACPWLPPSLIRQMAGDQFTARGLFTGGLAVPLVLVGMAGVTWVLWRVTRRVLRPFETFSVVFALWMCALPIGHFLLGVTLAPQANRYQLELELGVSLVVGCLCGRVGGRWRCLVVAMVLAVGIPQARHYRHDARALLRPLDITATIEYKTTMWLDRHFRGVRAMVSGDTEFVYNVFSDNPQLSGGHQPTAPNFMQQVAVYGIYTGAEPLAWLKVFGVRAITVPGPKSREFYHPFAHPESFAGLPVLWHEEDDTIYAVPQRSASLAHVIPRGAVVGRRPVHALDTGPLRPYLAALDDAGLPLAEMRWVGLSRALVRAEMRAGDVLSVQVNYMPGWRARVRGRGVAVHPDGIGLVVVEPGCVGPCEVELEFGPSTEAWFCRWLCGITLMALGASPLWLSRR